MNCGVSQRSILSLLLVLIYVNDLISKSGSYLYADNTCIFYQDKDVEKIEKS